LLPSFCLLGSALAGLVTSACACGAAAR